MFEFSRYVGYLLNEVGRGAVVVFRDSIYAYDDCSGFIDLVYCRGGGMETKLRETKLKLENSGEMRHTLVLWNQIISAIFRVQAWETKLK